MQHNPIGIQPDPRVARLIHDVAVYLEFMDAEELDALEREVEIDRLVADARRLAEEAR